MSILSIEGKKPLLGTVNAHGSVDSSIKLMYAAMFSNQDVVLENIPDIPKIKKEIDIIQSVGGIVYKSGTNKYVLNGSKINSSEVPYDPSRKYDLALLLAGPLLFRFGKAVIPLTTEISSINRLVVAWNALGISVEVKDKFVFFTASNAQGAHINFRTSTHFGTASTILSSIFLSGETVISNASEEPEVEDLVNFCNLMGADIKLEDSRRLVINGSNVFRGCTFEISSDKVTPIIYAVASVLTHGNIIIKRINKGSLTSLLHFFSNANINYEFAGSELKVWANESFIKPTNVTIAPGPAFIPQWKPYLTLLLTQADGVSLVHDTVYINRFDYVKDLNRMNAKIDLVEPSSVGLIPVISDDSYDFSEKGEPKTVIRITGPSKLRGQKVQIYEEENPEVFILASLAAEGRSEILNFDVDTLSVENFLEDLANLGAIFKII